MSVITGWRCAVVHRGITPTRSMPSVSTRLNTRRLSVSALTHTDTYQRTLHQRLPETTMCIGVPPSFMVFAMAFGKHVTQF
jgi:hypothetical protein